MLENRRQASCHNSCLPDESITLQVFVSLSLAVSSLGAPNLLEGGGHHHHGDHHHGENEEHHHHGHDAPQSPSVYFDPIEGAGLTPPEPHAHAEHAHGAPETKAEPEVRELRASEGGLWSRRHCI